METPPRDTEALRESLDAALGLTSPQSNHEHLLRSYETALAKCWARMDRTVGQVAAKAIVDHSIKKAARQRASVSLASARDGGVDLSALWARLKDDPNEAASAARDLCVMVYEVLAELTGHVLVSPLLAELAEDRLRGSAQPDVESWHGTAREVTE